MLETQPGEMGRAKIQTLKLGGGINVQLVLTPKTPRGINNAYAGCAVGIDCLAASVKIG